MSNKIGIATRNATYNPTFIATEDSIWNATNNPTRLATEDSIWNAIDRVMNNVK